MATRKKKKNKKTAKKKPSTAFAFLQAYLKKNPKASYQEVKAAAAKKRLQIAPVLYGRVQAVLGIVKMAKYGEGKAKKRKAAGRGPGRPKGSGVRRGPGRPRKKVAASISKDLVAEIRGIQEERDQAVEALARIRDILDSLG